MNVDTGSIEPDVDLKRKIGEYIDEHPRLRLRNFKTFITGVSLLILAVFVLVVFCLFVRAQTGPGEVPNLGPGFKVIFVAVTITGCVGLFMTLGGLRFVVLELVLFPQLRKKVPEPGAKPKKTIKVFFRNIEYPGSSNNRSAYNIAKAFVCLDYRTRQLYKSIMDFESCLRSADPRDAIQVKIEETNEGPDEYVCDLTLKYRDPANWTTTTEFQTSCTLRKSGPYWYIASFSRVEPIVFGQNFRFFAEAL